MNGTHVTEFVWFNAKKVLPDSTRWVALIFRKREPSNTYKHLLAMGRFFVKTGEWEVDSTQYNQNLDRVTQWAEIEPKRGAIAIPDPFPTEEPNVRFISNLEQ